MSTHSTASSARTAHRPRCTRADYVIARRLRTEGTHSPRTPLFRRQASKAHHHIAIPAPERRRSSRSPPPGDRFCYRRPSPATKWCPGEPAVLLPSGFSRSDLMPASRRSAHRARERGSEPQTSLDPATRLLRDSVLTPARALRSASSQPDARRLSALAGSAEDFPLRTDAAVVVDARERSQRDEQEKRWAAGRCPTCAHARTPRLATLTPAAPRPQSPRSERAAECQPEPLASASTKQGRSDGPGIAGQLHRRNARALRVNATCEFAQRHQRDGRRRRCRSSREAATKPA
jgi:hypothetical protein